MSFVASRVSCGTFEKACSPASPVAPGPGTESHSGQVRTPDSPLAFFAIDLQSFAPPPRVRSRHRGGGGGVKRVTLDTGPSEIAHFGPRIYVAPAPLSVVQLVPRDSLVANGAPRTTHCGRRGETSLAAPAPAASALGAPRVKTERGPARPSTLAGTTDATRGATLPLPDFRPRHVLITSCALRCIPAEHTTAVKTGVRGATYRVSPPWSPHTSHPTFGATSGSARSCSLAIPGATSGASRRRRRTGPSTGGRVGVARRLRPGRRP